MKNVEQLLKEAGSDLSHIVKTTTYLIDPRYREPVYQEVGKWLKGVFPISTGVVVSDVYKRQPLSSSISNPAGLLFSMYS